MKMKRTFAFILAAVMAASLTACGGNGSGSDTDSTNNSTATVQQNVQAGSSENSAASEAAPSEAAPSEAAPSEAAPSEAASSEAAPSEAAPSEAAPSEAAPSEAAPSEAAPSETVSPVVSAAEDQTPEIADTQSGNNEFMLGTDIAPATLLRELTKSWLSSQKDVDDLTAALKAVADITIGTPVENLKESMGEPDSIIIKSENKEDPSKNELYYIYNFGNYSARFYIYQDKVGIKFTCNNLTGEDIASFEYLDEWVNDDNDKADLDRMLADYRKLDLDFTEWEQVTSVLGDPSDSVGDGLIYMIYPYGKFRLAITTFKEGLTVDFGNSEYFGGKNKTIPSQMLSVSKSL